jgi:hypothetical protein
MEDVRLFTYLGKLTTKTRIGRRRAVVLMAGFTGDIKSWLNVIPPACGLEKYFQKMDNIRDRGQPLINLLSSD